MASIRGKVLGTVATAALLVPAAAWGQTAPAAGEQGDIVVTAQKRSERLLDVPVAITAISAESLTKQNVSRLTDFYSQVPGLQYAGQRVSNLSLRGITTGGATSPTVALLVDDVQFGGSTNVGQPPLPDFDASAIERIEVLRGPQGTLYGASSLGGLIKYVLKTPDTTAFSGRLEVGASSVSEGSEGFAARGSINIPLADWLAVAGSGFWRDDPRYLDNANIRALTARDVNTRKVWGFRGALLAKPMDNLSITLSALRQKQDAKNSDLAITSGGVPICVSCYPPSSTRTTATTTFEPVYGDLTINALDSFNTAKFSLYTARGELDLGAAMLTSISAWSKADNIISNDVSAVFAFLRSFYGAPAASTVQIGNADKTTKFSQELRLAGSVSSFDWLVGGFYTKEHAVTAQTLYLRDPSGTLLSTPYISAGPGSYREYAGFADLTWHATEQLDIQVGGRYAHNKQVYNSISTIDGPAQAAFGPSSVQSTNSSDSAFTWLISPSYHFSPDIMAYVRVASGYRPGGPNLDSIATPSFGPDRVINYEVGFKGKVVPGVVTIDTALFQIDWTKIQLQGTNPQNSLTFITNGGKARSRGIEFSTNITPWTGMSIDANFTYTDATLVQALPTSVASGLLGNAGDRLPFSAKYAANFSARQSFPIASDLDGSIGGTYTYVGDRWAAFNTNSATATRPRILIPNYSTVNLDAGISSKSGWSLTLYTRNLFNKRGISVAQNRNGVNVPTALFIQPRTIGFTLAGAF